MSKSFTLHVLGGKRVVALERVTFSTPPGTFVGLVGRSGSGKSTLLKCVYRTYLASTGQIWYRDITGDAHDLAAASDETVLALRRQEIGYVAQALRPAPRVPALSLVAEPLVQRGVDVAEARERATAMLRRLALPSELFGGYPALFSGGEQQRINLARALVAVPRLLLLDEPTAALDAPNQEIVLRLLEAALADGATIIGAFHDLGLLRRLADAYLVLDRGRQVAFTPAKGMEPVSLLAPA